MTAGRCKKVGWLYQARRIATQANVAGGALVIRISVPTGGMAELVQLYVMGSASATSALTVGLMDEDGAQAPYLLGIAAGASREGGLPVTGVAQATHQSMINSTGLKLCPGQFLRILSSVCLQNETLTVYICTLNGVKVELVWDTTGSGGTPSLAASTISVANTLQAVIM